MKLPIERWLGEAEIPSEGREAFEEAVVTYKAGACRAALLLSYLGWGLTIRNRVLTASRPDGMPEQKWQKILKKLRDDDSWDSQAYDCTQTKNPAPVFPISEDLRQQVRYWKDRRNDCAHLKSNQIDSAHVEAFWAFLRSNLGRFVVQGGEQDLLQRFARHYDPNYTPPGTTVEPLVRQLPAAVDPGRLKDFLMDLATFFGYKQGVPHVREALVEILDETLTSQDLSLQTAASTVLTSEAELLVALLRREPGRIQFFAEQPQLIRRLWHEQLFSDGREDLPVFVALVRNSLIPDDQCEEAATRVVKKLQGDMPKESELPELRKVDFFEVLKGLAFGEELADDFDWGNRNSELLGWYLRNFPLDETVVKGLCSILGRSPYPYKVRDAVRKFFWDNPVEAEKFREIAERLKLNPPENVLPAESPE